MWTRAELKQRAKAILRTNYWPAFFASLVLLLTGNYESRGPSFSFNLESKSPGIGGLDFMQSEWFSQITPLLLLMGLTMFLSAVALRIFLGYPLEVGGRHFFIEASQGKTELSNLGRAFNRQWYGNIIMAMFQRSIRIFAWSLLLIIPGIIKAYAYRFVPYLLADEPQMTWDRALELSNQMTAGHKWKIFVLDLSFIGWYLLGLLALGVGTLFVHPYVNATMAELYASLRQNSGLMGQGTDGYLRQNSNSFD